MKADDLRASILQAAIQGKLTKQDPNDESASVLVERIRDEKHRLVKEGKIKKDKNESFIFKRDGSWFETINGKDERCIDDEIPFEIPENWTWMRFGSIGIHTRGSGIKRTETVDQGRPCIRYGEIYTSYTYSFTECKSFIPESLFESINHATYGDILLTLTGENNNDIAKSVAYLGDETIAYGGDLLCISKHGFNPMFLSYVLYSPYCISQKSKLSTGNIIVHISSSKLSVILIPVPPIKEQECVVSSINNINNLVCTFERHEKSLSKLEQEAPDKLFTSTLQAAIQGKLTKQDSDDESASVLVERIREEKHRLVRDGKIKKDKNESFIFKRDGSWFETINGKDERCIDDEIPFEIPESWTWSRVYSICSMVRRGKSPVYSNIEKYPVLAQKCNQNDGLYLDRCLFIDPDTIPKYSQDMFLQDGDCLINSTGLGTLGRVGIYDSSLNKYECMVADSHITVVRPLIPSRFLLYYLKSPIFQDNVEDLSSGSTKQKELQTETVKQLLIPIPPIEEQTKVVDVIDKLLIQCNSMRLLHD